MSRRSLITVGEARNRLGVSNHTVARLVREGKLKTYPNPLDKRQKLVDAGEVAALLPPLEDDRELKRAA
jgi:predicted site-specific integrase-resolvase